MQTLQYNKWSTALKDLHNEPAVLNSNPVVAVSHTGILLHQQSFGQWLIHWVI